MTPEEFIATLLKDFKPISIGNPIGELGPTIRILENGTEIIEEGKNIDVSCQFCDKIYTFTPDDLRNLLKKAKK